MSGARLRYAGKQTRGVLGIRGCKNSTDAGNQTHGISHNKLVLAYRSSNNFITKYYITNLIVCLFCIIIVYSFYINLKFILLEKRELHFFLRREKVGIALISWSGSIMDLAFGLIWQ
jgi:hypothetical protein